MATFSKSTKSKSWDDYKKRKKELEELPGFSTEGQNTISSGINIINGANPNATEGINTINQGASYLSGLPEFSSDGVDAIGSAISGINGIGTFGSNGTNYINKGLGQLAGMKPFESKGYGYMQSGLEGMDKMGEFDSEYSDLYGEAIKNYANMGKFQYNLAGDPLFNQYKDNYIQMGKNAMQDTMGQPATLTGGYGNSYAAAAGQQAYNSYMNDLNNRIPELYSLALQNYNTEASRLQNVANMYGSAIDRDLNIYNTDLNRYGQLVTSGGQLVSADQIKYNAAINLANSLINGGGTLVDADATTYNTNLGRYTALGDVGAQKVSADSTVYGNKIKYGESLGNIGSQQVDAIDTVFDNTISQGNSIVSAGGSQVTAESTAKNYTLNYLTEVAGLSLDEAEYVTDMIYKTDRDKVADDQWDKEYNWATSPDNPSNQTKTITTGGSTPDAFSYTGNVTTYTDKNGNIVYTDANGKKKTVTAGQNPYTGKTNPRVLTNGVYDPSKSTKNFAYMPNTSPDGNKLTPYKMDGKTVKLTGTVKDADGNVWGENTQRVWKDTKTGKTWLWDVTKNEYVRVSYNKETKEWSYDK